ncbi:Hypothetical predicted protein [Mytilus galloprovincialis]|uniref:Uncharacterized protein n=1 Tax=Mytilus galloprovincialis TaxID=29158 RepID=A0A8B6BPQ4_MYTGA|nr:Hypothetical predicted protein [Mytilus galloprovincialis]
MELSRCNDNITAPLSDKVYRCESVKDVLILLCGKDDSIENVRLLVHESILLANSIGARGQRLGNPSTETPAAKGMNVTFLPNFG